MANFASAIPLSLDELVREERQYQYYPTYDYQQNGNGYTTYSQYGQYPYDGRNGHNNQNQQEIFDICDDRDNFQDKTLRILQGNQWPRPPEHLWPHGPRPQIDDLPLKPSLQIRLPNPLVSVVQNETPPKGTPSTNTGQSFFNRIKGLMRGSFGYKSFGDGIINKS